MHLGVDSVGHVPLRIILSYGGTGRDRGQSKVGVFLFPLSGQDSVPSRSLINRRYNKYVLMPRMVVDARISKFRSSNRIRENAVKPSAHVAGKFRYGPG